VAGGAERGQRGAWMRLPAVLTEKKRRESVLSQWLEALFGAYAGETASFLKSRSDRFANPVGYTFKTEIGSICEQLFGEMDREKLLPCVDRIVRIKAVQDFSPSQALDFVFVLKRIVRKELESEIAQNLISAAELWELDARIDRLGLLAFEQYVACREKLYEIRMDELHRKTFKLLQRANVIRNLEEETADVDSKDI